MKKLLVCLLAVGVLMAGSAAMAGELSFNINVTTAAQVVNGVTDYKAGDNHKEFYQALFDAEAGSLSELAKQAYAEEIALGPKLYNARAEDLELFFYSGAGHATLFSDISKGKARLICEDEDEVVGYKDLTGEDTFLVNLAPFSTFDGTAVYVITNEDGLEYGINGTAAAALSGQKITFIQEGTNAELTGHFPTILTTADQMEVKKCVPFVTYKLNADKTEVTGFDLRFVDPADTSTPLKAGTAGLSIDMGYPDNNIPYIIELTDGSGFRIKNRNIVWSAGGDMKDSIDFKDVAGMPASVKLTELESVQVRYGWGTRDGSSIYEWFFDTKEAEDRDLRQPVSIDFAPSSADAAAVSDEVGFTGTFKVWDESGQAELDTSTQIFSSYGTEVAAINALVSSALSVSQDVGLGNALVVGKPTLPLNSISAGGKAITGTDAINNLADVQAHFRVQKYFQQGGSIDLMKAFGSDLFAFTKGEGLKFKADLVIIDGPAPEGDEADDGIKRVFVDNSKYGVKLSGNKKVLFVFDGVKDRYASDPIAFMANEPETPNSSSGGCDAGFGLAALAAGAFVFLRRKR